MSVLILVSSASCHVAALFCFTLAFQKGKAGKVGIIAYSQIIYSMLIDLFIFNIKFDWIQATGMVIVFAFNFIIALNKI